MFNPFKKQKEEPKQELVKCETCKHLIERGDAQLLSTRSFLRYYYCPEHRKPYDGYSYDSEFRIHYFKTIPAQTIEVNEDGKPIKKKK